MTFGYYDDWKSQAASCRCGWQGTLENGNREPFPAYMDVNCPRCDGGLARIQYPTVSKPLYKDNHPGPVMPWELSPERLARARESAKWGRKFAEGMVKNLRKKRQETEQ